MTHITVDIFQESDLQNIRQNTLKIQLEFIQKLVQFCLQSSKNYL